MKKHLLFLFTALTLLLVPTALKAQTTVTIGDESSGVTAYILPVNMYFNYSLTQQIYTADEINMPDGGTITAISFNYTSSGAFSVDGIQVYMKNVSKDHFESSTDMVEVSSSDQVFSGAFSASGAGWATITLDAPFHYDGTSNLLVCLYDPTEGYPGNTYTFRCTSTGNNSSDPKLAVTYNSDTYIPDLSNIHTYQGGKALQSYRSNIQLTIHPDITDIYITGFTPPIWNGQPTIILSTPTSDPYSVKTSLCIWQDVTNNPANIFTGYVFNKEGHDYALKIYLEADNGYHFANDVTVHINGGTEIVKTQYSDGAYYVAQTIPFHTTMGNNVAIGSSDFVSSTTPYYSSWGYSFVEQVYTADELGTPTGGEISCIRFNMQSTEAQTNHITVYMKNVSRSEFSSASDYETVTADDIVYEGNYTFANGWNSIPLTTPFHYNGTDNLMIAIHENTSGFQSRYFYYTEKANSVLTFRSDSDDPDPYDLASWTSGQHLSAKRANIKIDIHPTTTVNNGTNANMYIPVDGHWADAYLKAEFVMPADSLTDIPNDSKITGMTFYTTAAPDYQNVSWGAANFKVFLKEVTDATLSDFTGDADATIVYEGALSVVDGKMTVPFSNAYPYHGGNLLVGVYNMVKGSYVTVFWRGVTTPGASVSGYNSNSLDAIEATQRNFLPKTTFTYTAPSDIIDFETGTLSQFPFNNTGTYPWTVVSDGYNSAYCMRSDNTGVASSTSTIEATYTFAGNGSISFDANCMGEGTSTYWDHCDFSIDGELQFTHGADLEGWNHYTFNVTAGTHTFTWSYIKDNSVNPTGDGFFVDNIEFDPGVPCYAPENLAASNITPNSANIAWTVSGDSYTVQYRPSPEDPWQTTTTTTASTQLGGLTPETTYDVQVQSDCGSDGTSGWSEIFTFTTTTPPVIQSTANWYSHAFANDQVSWHNHYINFSMQDPATVTAATSDIVSNIYTATYADGYMWYFNIENKDLGRAVVDNENHTISNFETIVPGFEYGNVPISMSYNPIDGRIYYYDSYHKWLKSFDPAHPETATLIGTTIIYLQTFAINSAGEAYGVEEITGDLYRLDLTDASTTLVGPTGHSCLYGQGMAFDLETGELFWAQYNPDVDNALYLVNPATAETYPLGLIGGGNGGEFTCLFMVSNTTPSCTAPSDLTVSYITDNSARLSWTENGTATEWQVCVNGNEGSPIDVTENPYILTGLTPDMSYTVKVRANCGDAMSDWSAEESFTTTEVIIASDFIDFETNDFSQHPFNHNAAYPWVIVDASQGCDNGSNYCMKSGNAGEHSTSSTIEATHNFSENGYITFQAKCMGEGEDYDVCEFYIDGNLEFTHGQELGGWNPYVFTVTAGTHTFKWSYSKDSSMNPFGDGFFVDNIKFGTGVPCVAPGILDISNIGNTSASIAWVENSEATAWQICINGNMDNLVDVNEEYYELTGLEPLTSYTVKVRANCGDGDVSAWSVEEIFTTLEDCPVPANLAASNITSNSADLDWTGFGESYTVIYRQPSVVFSDDFENGLGQWTQIDADNDGHGWGLGSVLNSNGYVPHGGFDIVCSQSYDESSGDTYYPDNYLVTPQVTLGGMVSFWAKSNPNYPAEHVGIAVSTTGNTDASDFTTIAEWTMEVGDWQQFTVDLSTYTGQTGYVALRHFDCYNEWILDIDDFTIYGPGPWQMTTSTTTNTTLSDLTASTTYEVQVMSNCGSYGTSGWSESFIFNSGICAAANQCTITLLLEDYAGDGWNGNAISVVDALSGHYYGTYTIWSGSSESYTIPVCEGMELAFKWKSGNYPEETSWTILNANGEVITTGTGDEYMSTGDMIYTYTVDCSMSSCPDPTDLAVSNITDNSAELSWIENGTATEWQICVNGNEGSTIDVTENPYILTGLTPNTNYTVKVRANCGDAVSDWSTEESFTTTEEIIVSDFIDFETNDFSQHPFNQDASYPWIIVDASNGCDNGSAYCMKSGNEGEPSSSSTIEATHDFSEDGYISFDAKCMGEGEDFDVCRFYIDGNLELYHGNDLGGWNQFAFAVTAGTHTFTWSYTKDGSVDPEGDGFFVDNIEFGIGMPCVAAWGITVNAVPDGNATVTWQGYSDSYTLQYMLEGSGDWNTVENITDLSYDITGLAIGNYVVRVAADCDPGNWASTTFSVVDVNSTANWYAYALYSSDGESWEQNCINFSMQDPSTVAEANWDVAPMIYAATYANGYMWYFNTSGDLGRAVVDNENQTISDFETIVPGLEPSTNAPTSMSYNPIDGRIYYNDYSIYTLKSFDPAHPEMATETGTTSISIQAFAINSAGEAYCVENLTGNLYHLDLTDASTTLVGPTGYSCDFVQAMAFDMETGELFWAHYDAGYSHSIYLVNTATAETYSLGSIGGGNGGEFAGLFMVGNSTPTCPAPTNLEATNTTQHTAELSWTENGTASEWQIMVNFNEGDIIDVYGNPYILDNLTAETEYTVMVRANCGGMWSDWSNEAHILTEVGCPATEDLTMMEFTSTTATLNWTGVGESFDLRYRASDGDWVEMEDVFPPYTLIGLMPNTSYEVQVMNDCGTEGLSLWSNLADFTTSDCPAPMALTANNITKHTADLSWIETGSSTEWEISLASGSDVEIIPVTGAPSHTLTGLAANTEYTVMVQSNCEGSWSGWGETISFITPTGCEASNDLALTDATYNTATLTWTGEGESYNLQYRTASGTWVMVENVTSPYTLEELTSNTNYEVQVQNNCGTDGLSDWSNLVTFTTLTCPAPTELTVTNTTKHTAVLSWIENGSATEWQMMVNNDEDNLISVTVNPFILDNLAAETEYTVMVRANCGGTWSDWSNEAHILTEVGCQTTNDLAVMSVSPNTVTLDWSGEGETYDLQFKVVGDEWVLVEDVFPPYTLIDLVPSTSYEVQVMNDCGTEGTSLWSNTVTFITTSCPVPTYLTATSIDKHSAMLTWNETGEATEWQIMVNNDEDNLINVSTNPYTLENLAAETEYTVKVRANCGGFWSDWSNEENFITPIGCQATNDLEVTNETYGSATLTWSGEGESFNVQYRAAGEDWILVEDVTSPYTLTGLTPGTDYEVQVQNYCGTDGFSNWSNLVTFTTLICPTPTGLTVTNVTKNSAVISWTENGSATVWQLHIDNHYIGMLDVYENPYTLTGLNAGTEYTVQVVAYCGAILSDLSEELTFTTDIPCHATEDLHLTAVTPNSATLDWTGEGDNFEMQYRTSDGEWVSVSSVTPPYTLTNLASNTNYEVQVRNICSGLGASEWSNMATFATSLCPAPANLTVTNITKNSAVLSWTETGTATAWELSIDNYHINLLDIGENPYTLTGLSAGTEYTVKVSAVCGASWSDWSNEVTFTTEVACTPSEDLAVTDYTYNTATLNWTGEGNVFHLRHRIPGGEWIATDGIVPPYTLTGLNPGTTYEAQVQNECIGGNQSEWSNLVSFTTSACDPQAIPYAYDFETEEPFYCWSQVAGDVELIQVLPSQNHTPNGEYSLAFYESASDVIAFPQFTQEVNTLQVSFWVRPHNITMSGYGTFSVGYLTDVNDASTFTAVSTYSYDEWPSTIDFLRKIVTLQDAPAGAIIAFKHDSPTANGTWYVDDILVSAICDVPTGITVSNITNHSATVTWTDNGASSWDVTLNSSMGYATNVTNNQYTFDNLTPGTNNYVMVRSRCGDDIISNWSEQVTFTTLENSIPTYATITGDSTVCYLSTTLLTAHTDVPATYLWSNGATTQQINVGAGTYQVTVTSATGNELASEPFTLTENPSLSGEESRSICPSELPYTWNGHTFPETGMAFVTLTASNGCDSIVTMILSVNPTFNDSIEATICEGESYHFAGQDLTESGVYTDSLQTIKGCDSVTVLTLIVNPSYALTVEQAVCESELPIVWNGKTFNEAGTQTATLQTVNECDSVVTMTLHVNPTYNIPVEATICSGQSYNFHGQILTAGGEYTHPMQTVNGCDSVEVLTLTVNPTYSVSEERSVCSGALPYTWNGITFNAPGTKFATLQTVNGCDSVVTMILSVSDAYEVTVTQTVCASELPIVWNGKTFTEAGTQIAELEAGNGCDSIVTMVLTVNTPVNTATTAEACGSYTWAANGQTYTESGTHYYEHPDAHGCTQVDTLHLTIYTPTNAAITEAVCGSYTWTDGNGVTYTESGTYSYEHQDAHNCTQVDTLYLTIYTPTNTAITETACGSYTWTGGDGVTYTESGTHYYEHPDAHGCTQVDTLYLTINNPVNTVTTEESCGNYTWAANGQTYYASGEYTYSHTDANGCTQVDTLRLTILQGSSAVVANTICANELPYEWNGVTFTAAGMQTATIEAANGCDSVITMVLMVNTPVNTESSAAACESYTWAANGVTYYESGEYTYAHPDINGCTQVDTLHLTIYNPVAEVVETSECVSYTWAANGQTYYESGEYTYAHTDAHGCTQVDTLRLTIYNPVDELVEATECGSYTWAANGQTYYESGEYNYTHTDAHGCTQVDTLRLTINNPVAEVVETTACGSYTWAANGQTYAVSGEYTYAHTDAHGCTQVDTLRLTILQGSSAVLTSTICASELPYVWNGVTFTEAGMQTTTLTAVNGCDSVVTMVLTVNAPPVNTAITATECGSYTWAANGQTYYESGVYTYSHPDVNGCTQVDTLYLTINHPVNTAITVSECGSYTWNGQTYTTSGVYTYSHTDANGCTQVDTLYLTISQSVQVELYETACGSYTWNGQTYTQSNDYSATFTAANGCDSIVVLHLTIINPVNTAITVEECDSYTWTGGNGQTYTTSGDYTYSHVDDNGCTQVDTLHLTIHYATTSEFTIETPDSCYIWNGQTYCASGDYVQTLQTVNGCDSVVTLHLTTSVGVSDHEVTTVFLAPNPTQNICRIMGLETDPVSVDLYDMRGKLVKKASGRELDVTTLPTGLYMVKVFTGDRFINLKLVKQ